MDAGFHRHDEADLSFRYHPSIKPERLKPLAIALKVSLPKLRPSLIEAVSLQQVHRSRQIFSGDNGCIELVIGKARAN